MSRPREWTRIHRRSPHLVSACLHFFAFRRSEGVYETFRIDSLMRNEHVLTKGGLPPLAQLRVVDRTRNTRRPRFTVGHA